MSTGGDAISQAWRSDIRFLQLVGELSGLAVALWRTGRQDDAMHWSSAPNHPCLCHEGLRQALEDYSRSGRPSLFFEDDRVIYAAVPVGPFTVALGPAAVLTASEETMREYAVGHGMDGAVPIPRCDLGTMERYMELTYLHFTGSALSREDISVTSRIVETWRQAGELEEYQLAQSEHDRSHAEGAAYENAMISAVKQGDVEAIKTLLSGPSPDYDAIAKVSDRESKSNEYLVVSVITLLTRAAVEGGAPLETAHALGDVYLRRLSRAAERREPFRGLSYNAILEFTQLVQQAKASKSTLSYVDECKAYIEENLRKNLQVGDIAPAIGLSRTYLSRLFHQSEGVTVQQYIQREKCRHAARMLQYSDFTISQISQYFGFSSQSYFGACFQTWYGMTPNAYRKANR